MMSITLFEVSRFLARHEPRTCQPMKPGRFDLDTNASRPTRVYFGEIGRPFRECGIGCEDTDEVPSRPGLTQELTCFVPYQRFVVWGWAGRLAQPPDDVVT
jgi:hypothetical protein